MSGGLARPLEDLRRLAGKKWRAHDDDVLACWIADMDLDLAEPIRRYLARAVELGDFGYPGDPHEERLPEAFARRAAARWGWEIDPARVEAVTDVVQALYVAIETLSEAGQGVVVQTPIYPPFLNAVAETGRRAVVNPLVPSGDGWELDLDHLRGAVDRDTRLLMLCNPHNPTGRVLRRDELEALADVALAHDLVVLSDEIHADVTYAGARHVPFASLAPEVAARTVTFNSATKAFNTAGLRCAIVAFGSEDLERRFARVPRRVRGGLSAHAAAVTRIAWEECDEWHARVLRHLEDNRDRLAEFVAARMPGVAHRRPQATYLAWLDCRRLGLAEEASAFFLREARVATSHGPAFGPEGRGCVRVNFATSRAILSEILERMARAIERA